MNQQDSELQRLRDRLAHCRDLLRYGLPTLEAAAKTDSAVVHVVNLYRKELGITPPK